MAKPENKDDGPVLRTSQLRLSYGQTKALDSVTLDLHRGEIIGVVGRNGAGKSSLVSVLSGARTPDSGTMTLDGEVYNPTDVDEARAAGVGYVPQTISIPQGLTVAEAIFRTSFRSSLSLEEQIREGRELLEDYGVDIAAEATVEDLYPAEHASLELLRMACEETQVILLDEVSAAFDDHEISLFHALAKRLASDGRSLLFISHRLDEIQALSDRILVMREGHVHSILSPRDTDQADVVGEIFGSSFELRHRPDPAPVGVQSAALQIRDVSTQGLTDISLAVNRGEVLGITGARRSGISELAEVLGGCRRIHSGTILVDEKTVILESETDAQVAGIAYVPEADNERDVDDQTDLKQALTKTAHASDETDEASTFSEEAAELRGAIRLIQRFGIQTKSLSQIVGTLSGGDRNKVALARVLSRKATVFVLNQPTRGIDVRAKQDLYGLIEAMCAQGCAVVLISSDLSELVGHCQRVAVLRHGELVDIYRNEDVTEDSIMVAALGKTWLGDDA